MKLINWYDIWMPMSLHIVIAYKVSRCINHLHLRAQMELQNQPCSNNLNVHIIKNGSRVCEPNFFHLLFNRLSSQMQQNQRKFWNRGRLTMGNWLLFWGKRNCSAKFIESKWPPSSNPSIFMAKEMIVFFCSSTFLYDRSVN